MSELLQGILGSKETGYSKFVALALAISEEFRAKFLGAILDDLSSPGKMAVCELLEKTRNEQNIVSSVLTERNLGAAGRIDIEAKFASGLVLGIENKVGADLRENQLEDYAGYYRAAYPTCHVLVYLTPSTYSKKASSCERDHAFVHFNYGDLIGWSKAVAGKREASLMERDLFRQAEYYFMDADEQEQRVQNAGGGTPRTHFDWNKPGTWASYNALPEKLGFRFDSNAILLAAAYEMIYDTEINSFEELDDWYDRDWAKYTRSGERISENRYLRRPADFVMVHADDPLFAKRARNVARRLSSKLLPARIQHHVETNQKNRHKWSTELQAQYGKELEKTS